MISRFFFKHLFVFVLIIFFSSSIPSKAENEKLPDISSWPSLKEVINGVYLYYNLDTLEGQHYIDFARTPDGWFMRVVDYNGLLAWQEPFWMASTHGYVDLSFQELDDDSFDEQSEQLIINRDAALEDEDFFKYNLFYGYPEWENDVIYALEPHFENLDDNNLNYIARAYSSLGRKILSPNVHELIGDFNLFDSTFQLSDINQKIISRYVELSNKAIHAYNVIFDRNPEFRSFTGRIHTVLSNEHMTSFLQLSLVGEFDLANQFLANDLYSPFLHSIGKNQLNSCRENGILITQGDSDTYLLTYLQQKYGLRPDVTIMNIGLMNWGRYINYLINFIPEQKAIKTTIPYDRYRLGNYSFVYIDENPYYETIEIKDLISNIVFKEDTFETYNDVIRVPSERFKLQFSRQKSPENVRNDDNFWMDDEPLMTWNVYERHIYKNELFFWDVLATNEFIRPIYFVSAMSHNFHLKEFLVSYGLLNEVFPFPKEFQPAPVLDLLEMEFDFSAFKDDSINIDLRWWIDNMKYSYSNAISEAISNEDYDLALELLNKVYSEFGNKYGLYSKMDIFFSYNYWQINRDKEASELIEKIFKQWHDKFYQLTELRKPGNESAILESISTVKQAYEVMDFILDEEELEHYDSELSKIQTRYEEY